MCDMANNETNYKPELEFVLFIILLYRVHRVYYAVSNEIKIHLY